MKLKLLVIILLSGLLTSAQDSVINAREVVDIALQNNLDRKSVV